MDLSTLDTDSTAKLSGVDEDIEDGFADVGIELSHAGTETLNILGQQLVRVGNAVVQVRHLVVCEPYFFLKIKIPNS